MRGLEMFDRSGRGPAGMVFVLGLAFGWLADSAAASAQQLKLDPAKVMGPDACGECHKTSAAAWKETTHAKTFKSMPRGKEAKKIAKNLGLKRIKAESDCLSCHCTSAEKSGKVKPIAGIVCESCHGAGKDWIKLHSDYGGKDVTRENEDPAHKKERYAKSEAAGMIRPGRLYDVASNCFGCHTVPNERLVNVGGHPAGSKFELVSWTHGEVRHNVWYTKENNESSAPRKRLMYVVGLMLDFEYGLRGVAKATKKAKYAKAMARRASRAKKALAKVAKAVQAPEIAEILAVAKGAKLKLNNEAALTAAADKVAAIARGFVESRDGSQLAAVDPLVPGADKYKGKAAK